MLTIQLRTVFRLLTALALILVVRPGVRRARRIKIEF